MSDNNEVYKQGRGHPIKTKRERKNERQLAIDTGPRADGIEQDIVRVSTSFPHREPGKTRVGNEYAFRGKRGGIVEGHHHI